MGICEKHGLAPEGCPECFREEVERLDVKVERLEEFLGDLKRIGEEDGYREIADICEEALRQDDGPA